MKKIIDSLNLSDTSKKFLFLTLIMICIVLIIIVIVLIIGSADKKEKTEKNLALAAQRYYQKYYEDKAEKTDSIEISYEKLYKAGYIKELEKLMGTEGCNASVIITKNNDYIGYTPLVSCSKKEKATKLNLKIRQDNPVVSEKAGLYKINNDYFFRGEIVNNYVLFAGKTWRIISIKEDGTVRMIDNESLETAVFDDRYNTSKESDYGYNTYELSRLKEQVDGLFNGETVFNNYEKSIIIPQKLCVGSRSKTDTGTSGEQECSKTLDNQSLGFIQTNEYMIGSIDENCKTITSPACTNYNYLSQFKSFYWTVIPNAENSYEVYQLSKKAYISYASHSAEIKVVIELSPNAIYSSGDGTNVSPYAVKEY